MKNTKRQSAFENSEDSSSSALSADVGDLYSFSQRDLEFIVKFKEEYGSDTFRRILHSVCPSIYGHEIVKGNTSLHNKFPWDIIGEDLMITIRSIAYHDTSVVCFFLIISTAGIALSLFGGVRKHSMDRNKVPVRGDIHVIIVGKLSNQE